MMPQSRRNVIAESGSYLLVLMSKFRVGIRVARLVD